MHQFPASPHVVVVGAGIIGAGLAHRLARRGARVSVLEAQGPAAGASGASFGWINASFFLNAAHFQLRAAGIRAYHALETELATGIDWSGAISWEEEGPALVARAAELARLGYRVEALGPAAFTALCPSVAPPPQALLFADEGAVDPARLTRALLRAAEALGAQCWLGCPVTGFLSTEGRITGVTCAQGTIAADHVILATGTASEGLLAPLGIALPMLARPGVLFRTQELPRLFRHVMIGPGGVEFRQDAEGHILAPAEPGHQHTGARPNSALPGALADAALPRLQALLPSVPLRWERVMLGHRPVPADGLPVVGQAASGLSLAVMHSGVTLAAITADLLAAEVLDGTASPLLASFRPHRFATAPGAGAPQPPPPTSFV